MSSGSSFQLKASITTNKNFLGISIVKGKNSGISIGTILKGKKLVNLKDLFQNKNKREEFLSEKLQINCEPSWDLR